MNTAFSWAEKWDLDMENALMKNNFMLLSVWMQKKKKNYAEKAKSDHH